MNYYIYQITNNVNGKIYIGKHKTKNLNDNYFGSGKLLKRAIEKHGKENFTKEILFTFDSEEELNDKEKELVTEEFCLLDSNYNLCVGGQGGFSYINRGPLRSGFEHRPHDVAVQYTKGLEKIQLLRDDPLFRERFAASVSKGTRESYKNPDRKNYFKDNNPMNNETLRNKHKTSLANISHQQGSLNSQYGTKWITDGTINRKISKSCEVPEGWRPGRTICKPIMPA